MVNATRKFGQSHHREFLFSYIGHEGSYAIGLLPLRLNLMNESRICEYLLLSRKDIWHRGSITSVLLLCATEYIHS
jgi:hypothetical protein